MSERTLRDGTIMHQREGNPARYVPQFYVAEGTDVLELLHPERETERLRAENERLRAALAFAASCIKAGGESGANRWTPECERIIDGALKGRTE